MITPEKLLESAKELETQLRTWRRTLHRHPEVGFDLPETKALVKKALTEMGYTPQDCGKCGGIMMFNVRKASNVNPLPVFQKIAEGAFGATVTYTGTEYSQDWTFNPAGYTITYADIQ